MKALPQRVELVPLQRLLSGISEGLVVLPEFQREYVWSNRDARALIATILQGWPAGSLLLMEGMPEAFAVRPFEGQTSANAGPEVVVLDGQQRLTALFQALTDKGPYRFYLDLDLLAEAGGGMDLGRADPEDVEGCIVAKRRTSTENDQLRPSGTGLGLLPLGALRTASDFYRWVDVRPAQQAALTDLYRSTLSGVHAYQFPCVYLDRGIDVGVIARIFERLNRSGLQLAAFDLAVARAFKEGWNLRDEWERACDRWPDLAAYFGDDGLIALQVIALAHVRDVRQAAVLRLDPTVLRERWNTSTEALAVTLRFLRSRCGVYERRWLPYRATVLALAAAAMESQVHDFPADAERWFWETSFAQRFEVAANTRVVPEFERLKEAFTAGVYRHDEPPIDLSRVWFGTRRGNSAMMRAFECAAAQRLREQGFLEPDARAPRVEHFFGKRSWSASEWDERLYDRVLNYLIVPPFERYDRDAPPPLWISEQWVSEIRPTSTDDFLVTRLAGLVSFLEDRGVRIAGDPREFPL